MPLSRRPSLVGSASPPSASASRRSSFGSQEGTSSAVSAVVSIEPLHSEKRTERRLSFEKSSFVVTAEFSSMFDDLDDLDSGSDSDDDSLSLDGIPTAEEAPEISSDYDNNSEEVLQGSFHQSVDIDDIAAAVNSFNSSGGSTSSNRSRVSSGSAPGSRRGSGSGRGALALSRIEDEIIERAIQDGKLVAKEEDRGENPQESTTSKNGSDARRRSSFTFGGRRRRVSFTRPSSSLSLCSMTSPSSSRRGSLSRSSLRAGPNLHRDISTALRQQDLDGEEDFDDEAAEDAAIARAVLATGGTLPSGGGGGGSGSGVVTMVEVEMAVPPPRDARPRRSSLKKPQERRNWS